MKVNNEEFIALCANHGIEGIDIVNELMRFKVLDQLISSNASSREWGVTADDLYALAEKSTVESFGPVPYDLNTFQALYGPSFRVELFDFISDTGILEGLDVGTIWETPVRESIEAHSKTGELVLYAYVEEYAGMVEEILQSYEDKKVVLYTASPVCYSILTRLYPMAQIINQWPHRSYFDHIFTGTVGMFQSSEDIVEELFRITQVIRIGGIVLIAFLAAATLFIISNTIRLTVFARRKEIAIMKYVGATNGFIRWPFLIEGMLLGLIGAIIAVLCVGEFYHFITMEVSESLAFFPLVPMFPFFYDVALYILGGGIVVGAIGSTISLKQYMKV